jgi:uncharacterized membrane protein
MSTGELMGLPIAGLGVWYALARGRRRAGGVIVLLGLAWTFFAVYVVVPHFSGGGSMFYGFFDEVGGSPVGLVRTLFSDPGVVLSALVQARDFAYLVWLALPVLGLFVLSPGLAAVALPQLLVNSLSDFRSMTDPRYHSVAAVIPFLLAATVFGVARLRARQLPAAAAVLVASTTLTLVVGPWARAVGATPFGGRETVPAEHVAALRDAIALVPHGVAVSASNMAGAHLSARRYVYVVETLGAADWVVLDLDDPWVVRDGSPLLTSRPESVERLALRLERAAWQKVFERDRVIVFRKRS